VHQQIDHIDADDRKKTGWKARMSKLLSIALPLLLGTALIVYQYNQFTPEQLRTMAMQFKTANYTYIYLSLAVSLLGFVSRAYRWKFALEHMGYTARFSTNLFAVCISYFINLTIPRSGEVSRAVILKKYEGVPFAKGFGTIVAERVVDLVIFFLFVLLSLLFEFKTLKTFILATIPVKKLVLLGAAATVFGIVFLLVWIYSRWTLIARLKAKVAGLTEGFLSIFLMKKKWAYLAHSLFIWLSYLIVFYITIFALPQTSHIGFGAVMMGFVFGTLAIGFTNSGFGAYPLLIAQIFVLYRIPYTAGTAFGWLTWISQTALIIVLGLLSSIVLPLLRRNE